MSELLAPDRVRAISLWQPWASAVALGLKTYETRHWWTGYRGPLVIHAARRWTRAEREFAAVEHALGRLPKRLPLGALVCICDLVDVQPTEDAALAIGAVERIYGNYAPGRFAWKLENVRAFDEPIVWAGRQGFFTVPMSDLPIGAKS